MPTEFVFGDSREFAFDREYERPDWPNEIETRDLKPGQELAIYRRGLMIRWNRETWLEIGVGPVETATHAMHASSHFVTLDYHALRKAIRDLQKAGRQMYGPDPW